MREDLTSVTNKILPDEKTKFKKQLLMAAHLEQLLLEKNNVKEKILFS